MCTTVFVRSNILRATLRSCVSITKFTGIEESIVNQNAYQANKMQPSNKWSPCKLFSTSQIYRQNDKLISVVYNKIGDDGTAKTITMMSPKTRNSLSLEMIESLIEQIHDDSGVNCERARCIVIKGEGKAFSAGHNLKEMTMNEGRDYHAKIFERCNALMDRIISCPIPVVAVVDGVAAAAGCQLVAICDIAIATEASR